MNQAIQTELFDPAQEPQMQIVQAHLKGLLTDVFLDEQPVPRLLEITALVPAHCRPAWRLVYNTLLARRLTLHRNDSGAGAKLEGHRWADWLSAQWQQPVLAQRWQRLLNELTPGQGLRLIRQARRRGLAH